MNRTTDSADLLIVGAGIIGLAHAYMALKKGLKVVLIERDEFATGASVRNFGLIWPVGQAPGIGLTRATSSRRHWQDIAKQAGFWINNNGSIHLAYHDDEWEVLNEFVDRFGSEYCKLELMTPNQVAMRSLTAKTHMLKGGLWSSGECTVNPREAVPRIADCLVRRFGLDIYYGRAVTSVEMPFVKSGSETWRADHVLICSGSDFETLYPHVYSQQELIKCKLQMMKGLSRNDDFRLGPTLCAGLTLRHYAAFRACASLKKVDQRYDEQSLKFKEHGIHVLLAQHAGGELIIGDSHHYGKTVDPFGNDEIDRIILDYMHTFADVGELRMLEHWQGVYPKTPDGTTLILEPEHGVTIVNGLGGAGMTLSFGLAEEVIGGLF